MKPHAFFSILIAIACAFGLQLSTPASQAMTLQTPALSDLFNASDRVIEARIDKAESVDTCGTRYTATVLMSFKGKATVGSSEIIKFGRWNALQTGGVYLLFLSYVADPHELLDRFPSAVRSAHTEAELLNAANCHGLAPGYEFNSSLVGEFHKKKFELKVTPGYMGAPLDLPLPVVEADPYGHRYIVRGAEITRYLKSLRTHADE